MRQLLREGVQYYHRYLSLWHLKRYELCARDTARNLRLFAFVRESARHERDKLQFDQWRPYVTMMHTRAVATPLVELEQIDAALTAIESGIDKIEAFLADYQQSDKAARCGELQNLKRWREELQERNARDVADEILGREPAEHGQLAEPASADGASGGEREGLAAADPPSEIALLRSQLAEAVAGERYEEAALLRDEIRRRDQTAADNAPPASGE
ncbi:MAG: UvrB/UvrC motif-containing protein [Pirellulales bacterium]